MVNATRLNTLLFFGFVSFALYGYGIALQNWHTYDGILITAGEFPSFVYFSFLFFFLCFLVMHILLRRPKRIFFKDKPGSHQKIDKAFYIYASISWIVFIYIYYQSNGLEINHGETLAQSLRRNSGLGDFLFSLSYYPSAFASLYFFFRGKYQAMIVCLVPLLLSPLAFSSRAPIILFLMSMFFYVANSYLNKKTKRIVFSVLALILLLTFSWRVYSIQLPLDVYSIITFSFQSEFSQISQNFNSILSDRAPPSYDLWNDIIKILHLSAFFDASDFRFSTYLGQYHNDLNRGYALGGSIWGQFFVLFGATGIYLLFFLYIFILYFLDQRLRKVSIEYLPFLLYLSVYLAFYFHRSELIILGAYLKTIIANFMLFLVIYKLPKTKIYFSVKRAPIS